jgi:ferritin
MYTLLSAWHNNDNYEGGSAVMAEREEIKQQKKGNFFTYINNNGIRSKNKNPYKVEERDWIHRIERLRDK